MQHHLIPTLNSGVGTRHALTYQGQTMPEASSAIRQAMRKLNRSCGLHGEAFAAPAARRGHLHAGARQMIAAAASIPRIARGRAIIFI
jgi:hypothetical protein